MEIIDNINPNYRLIKDFLTNEQLDKINLDLHNTTEDLWNLEFETIYTREQHMDDNYWNGILPWRGMSLNIGNKKLFNSYNLDKDFYYNIHDMAKKAIEERFNVKVKHEHFGISRWRVGRSQTPHIDYLIDGEDNDIKILDDFNMNKQWRDSFQQSFTTKNYSTIIYINDDFDGGNLYFPQYNNLTITPEPKMSISFKGDTHHLHGVTEVTKGTRYTISIFWTEEKNG